MGGGVFVVTTRVGDGGGGGSFLSLFFVVGMMVVSFGLVKRNLDQNGGTNSVEENRETKSWNEIIIMGSKSRNKTVESFWNEPRAHGTKSWKHFLW